MYSREDAYQKIDEMIPQHMPPEQKLSDLAAYWIDRALTELDDGDSVGAVLSIGALQPHVLGQMKIPTDVPPLTIAEARRRLLGIRTRWGA
jgi:hypothetical protein